MSHVLMALSFASLFILSSTVMPLAFAQNSTIILSPLKQIESGIQSSDVKCREGFVLVLKTLSNFPACVTPHTASKIIERGWGKLTEQASTPSIAVTTDKPSYNMGDAITISGIVELPITSTTITILILDPNDLLLQAERISVSSDGVFQGTIMTTPSIWILDGMYTVEIQYGTSNTKAQTTFNFAK